MYVFLFYKALYFSKTLQGIKCIRYAVNSELECSNTIDNKGREIKHDRDKIGVEVTSHVCKLDISSWISTNFNEPKFNNFFNYFAGQKYTFRFRGLTYYKFQ